MEKKEELGLWAIPQDQYLILDLSFIIACKKVGALWVLPGTLGSLVFLLDGRCFSFQVERLSLPENED